MKTKLMILAALMATNISRADIEFRIDPFWEGVFEYAAPDGSVWHITTSTNLADWEEWGTSIAGDLSKWTSVRADNQDASRFFKMERDPNFEFDSWSESADYGLRLIFRSPTITEGWFRVTVYVNSEEPAWAVAEGDIEENTGQDGFIDLDGPNIWDVDMEHIMWWDIDIHFERYGPWLSDMTNQADLRIFKLLSDRLKKGWNCLFIEQGLLPNSILPQFLQNLFQAVSKFPHVQRMVDLGMAKIDEGPVLMATEGNWQTLKDLIATSKLTHLLWFGHGNVEGIGEISKPKFSLTVPEARKLIKQASDVTDKPHLTYVALMSCRSAKEDGLLQILTGCDREISDAKWVIKKDLPRVGWGFSEVKVIGNGNQPILELPMWLINFHARLSKFDLEKQRGYTFKEAAEWADSPGRENGGVNVTGRDRFAVGGWETTPY